MWVAIFTGTLAAGFLGFMIREFWWGNRTLGKRMPPAMEQACVETGERLSRERFEANRAAINGHIAELRVEQGIDHVGRPGGYCGRAPDGTWLEVNGANGDSEQEQAERFTALLREHGASRL